ncbi:hypothetical protein CP8484711_2477, partial [Chlamydia psittaci 84-8471/1]
MTNVS